MPSAGQPGKATQQVLNSLHAVYPARPDSSDAHSERSGMMRQSTVCVCVFVCIRTVLKSIRTAWKSWSCEKSTVYMAWHDAVGH